MTADSVSGAFHTLDLSPDTSAQISAPVDALVGVDERVYGHDRLGVTRIQSAMAHRCKILACDALVATEVSHCPTCHRSFAADYLDAQHIRRGPNWIALEHRDPTTIGARTVVNAYGWPVWHGPPATTRGRHRQARGSRNSGR